MQYHLVYCAVILATAIVLPCCQAFVSSRGAFVRTMRVSSSDATALAMALTPIGPFCPFRSKAAINVEPNMEELNDQAPEFATEMARIQLAIQNGKDPDKDQLFRVADGIDLAVSNWEQLLARLRGSGDFQTREYAKLTQVHLAASGVTPEGVANMMRWQGGCMRALALSAPPPMPPKDLDLQRLMNNAGGSSTPSVTRMSNAVKITSDPFDESALKTETIKAEYEQLCRDHNALIEFGAQFSTFDPSGKIAYIDEIETIEERWDIFFARFSLMGELNPVFIEQCTGFLNSMNLQEGEYRDLLKKSHDLMRQEAEEERDIISF